jgi:DNA invertase Pin-like site-specific DNA recombinase
MQSPTSIEDQVALCERYVAERGWEIVGTYSDAALSGFSSESRPSYQRLIADARLKHFSVILVEAVDRLTRELGELVGLYNRLRFHGVEIVGVRDGVATGNDGAKLHLALKGLMNDLFLDDLRAKTHRGLEGRARRGLSAGGRTFGYRTYEVDGGFALAIEEAEGAIVRRIYAEYAAGHSLRAIAKTLNREGVPFPAKDTKRGPARKGWSIMSLRFILRNERYEGRLIWNRYRYLKDPDTGRRRPQPRTPSEWILEDRPELRIVPPELAAAVRERVAMLASRYADGRDGQRLGPATQAAYSSSSQD